MVKNIPGPAAAPSTAAAPSAPPQPKQAPSVAVPAPTDTLTRAPAEGPAGRVASPLAAGPVPRQPGEVRSTKPMPPLEAKDGGSAEPIAWPRGQDLVVKLEGNKSAGIHWHVVGGDLPKAATERLTTMPAGLDPRNMFGAGQNLAVFRWPSKGHPRAGSVRTVTMACTRHVKATDEKAVAQATKFAELTFSIKFV